MKGYLKDYCNCSGCQKKMTDYKKYILLCHGRNDYHTTFGLRTNAQTACRLAKLGKTSEERA